MKKFLMLVTAFMISSSFAFADSKNDKTTKSDTGSWMKMSAETRKQMADMHQKMADCLKSEKSISECRDTVMDNCPMMKDGSCPMMGMMHGHHDDDHDCMMHR